MRRKPAYAVQPSAKEENYNDKRWIAERLYGKEEKEKSKSKLTPEQIAVIEEWQKKLRSLPPGQMMALGFSDIPAGIGKAIALGAEGSVTAISKAAEALYDMATGKHGTGAQIAVAIPAAVMAAVTGGVLAGTPAVTSGVAKLSADAIAMGKGIQQTAKNVQNQLAAHYDKINTAMEIISPSIKGTPPSLPTTEIGTIAAYAKAAYDIANTIATKAEESEGSSSTSNNYGYSDDDLDVSYGL